VRGDVFGPAEYRFQHANRSWRVLEVVGTNLLHDGRIDGLVVRLRDITERRRLEQELAQLHRLTSLGRLSAQVAHEFNNVLMGIQPAVDVMRRRMADQPELLPLLEAINVSISRGKRITTDVLKFGRPAQLTSTPVRPADLLSKVVDELRPMLNENVRVNLALSDTPLMLADPAQLSQVFMNLALNARDAMPSGGTLTIRASLAHGSESGSPQPFIHFAVSDTGTGIPDEDLSWIFEPLFTTKKTGTGLGLSVVYQIVTLHGGRISVESQRGKGTTFDILIPAMAAGETPADEAEAVEPSRPECQRILIVDDEELVALGLRVSLEGHGFDVEVVGTGAEVMAAIDRFKPDVVVLDLSLPDADGREVYAEISSRFAVPVLFSSGHAAEWEIGKLLTAPGTGFLMKPYSTDELLATIRTLVASSEARR
jgi:two-component system cell cycle sensor histidine kinase/response regulator CckA